MTIDILQTIAIALLTLNAVVPRKPKKGAKDEA
jgi:hypothetical protein